MKFPLAEFFSGMYWSNTSLMKEDQCDFKLIWQTVLKTHFLGELSGDDSLLESSVVRSEDVINESIAPRSVRFFFSRRNSLHVLLLLFYLLPSLWVLHLVLNVLACINLTCVSCKICERLSQKNYGLDQMSAVILLRWSSSRVQINK